MADREAIARADRLDDFWNELLRTGSGASFAGARAQEAEAFSLVQRLQAIAPTPDLAAQSRLRNRILASDNLRAGNPPASRILASPARQRSHPTPANMEHHPGRAWISRGISFAGMAALLIAAIGLVYLFERNRGWISSNDPGQTPSVPVAAQVQATPHPGTAQDPATPFSNTSELTQASRAGVLWTLSPASDQVAAGHATLIDGTIYRLSASQESTGVESIDAATGAVNWSLPLSWTGSGFDADEQAVYVPVHGAAGEREAVVALDPNSGEELWRGESTTFVENVSVSDGVVYVWDGFGQLASLDAATGEMRWLSSSREQARDSSTETLSTQAPVAWGDVVITIDAFGQINGFDRSDGTHNWLLPKFAPGSGTLVLADNGAILAIGLEPHEGDPPQLDNLALLLAIDPASGAISWEKEFLSVAPSVQTFGTAVMVLADVPGRASGSVTLIEADGTETVVQDDRANAPLRVFGLDLASGELIRDPRDASGSSHGWVSNQGEPPFSSLASYGPGGDLVLALADPGRVTSLSADGRFVGIVDLGQSLSDPILSNEQGAYALLADGSLASIDPGVLEGDEQVIRNTEKSADFFQAFGAIDWTLPLSATNGQFTALGGMSQANGLVYRLLEGTAFKGAQAVHGPTGSPAWQVSIDWSHRGFWADESGVYLVNTANQIVALDPFTGAERWNVPFDDRAIVSFTLHDGVLYVWDETSTMTAIDAVTGAVSWNQNAGNSGGPQVAENGYPKPLVAENVVAMVDVTGAITAFDREVGAVLWTQPGFNALNTRMAYQPGTLFVVTADGQAIDGLQALIGTALDLNTGAIKWTIGLTGPLYQPVATNETNFYLIADEVTAVSAIGGAIEPYVDYDGPEPGSWSGSKAAAVVPLK